jgi:hypothetical protein
VAEPGRLGRATEEQREVERTALLSLAVHSYRERDELRATINRISEGELVDPESALHDLAKATEEGFRVTPRLMVINTLIRLIERDGQSLFEEQGGGMTRLLQALVADAPDSAPPESGETAPAPPPPPAEAAEDLRQLFLRAAEAGVAGGAREQIMEQLAVTLRLTDAERWGPRCDDRTGVLAKPGVYATEVAVEFWTDRTVGQMAPWADPRNWPHCSLYFESMAPITPLVGVAGPPQGWRGRFMEVVSGFPGKTLETPLEFNYTEDLNEDYVICSYDLVQPTNDIDFDRGNLWARVDGTGPPNLPTHVSSTKLIHFTDPEMQAGASLSCDTFWTELAITMALTCTSTGAPGEYVDPPPTNEIPPVKGGAPVPDDKDKQQDANKDETASDLDLLFKQVLTEATASVQRYTELATNAAKRMAAGNVDPADWSKDIAAAAANYVNDVGNVLANWTKAAQIVSGDSGEEADEQPEG